MDFARSRAVIPTERESKPLFISSLDFFYAEVCYMYVTCLANM